MEEMPNLAELIGGSQSFRRVQRLVELAAVSKEPVLLLGESGAGKKHIARTIHQQSELREKELKHVVCSSPPQGIFQPQNGGVGTLYLEELADLDADSQKNCSKV